MNARKFKPTLLHQNLQKIADSGTGPVDPRLEAKVAELNAKFGALEGLVNGNAQRLQELEKRVIDLEGLCKHLQHGRGKKAR